MYGFYVAADLGSSQAHNVDYVAMINAGLLLFVIIGNFIAFYLVFKERKEKQVDVKIASAIKEEEVLTWQ